MDSSVWQELPNELQWVVRGMRTQLMLNEHPDLLMTHKYGTCYCCGGWADISGHKWWDGMSYNFCGSCEEGQFKDLDMETRVMYCNAWGGNDPQRWSRMYHTAIAPEVEDTAWDDFWEERFEGMKPEEVRSRFDTWEVRMAEAAQRYQDDWLGLAPPTPPGNGYAFEWPDTDEDEDVES